MDENVSLICSLLLMIILPHHRAWCQSDIIFTGDSASVPSNIDEAFIETFRTVPTEAPAPNPKIVTAPAPIPEKITAPDSVVVLPNNRRTTTPRVRVSKHTKKHTKKPKNGKKTTPMPHFSSSSIPETGKSNRSDSPYSDEHIEVTDGGSGLEFTTTDAGVSFDEYGGTPGLETSETTEAVSTDQSTTETDSDYGGSGDLTTEDEGLEGSGSQTTEATSDYTGSGDSTTDDGDVELSGSEETVSDFTESSGLTTDDTGLGGSETAETDSDFTGSGDSTTPEIGLGTSGSDLSTTEEGEFTTEQSFSEDGGEDHTTEDFGFGGDFGSDTDSYTDGNDLTTESVEITDSSDSTTGGNDFTTEDFSFGGGTVSDSDVNDNDFTTDSSDSTTGGNDFTTEDFGFGGGTVSDSDVNDNDVTTEDFGFGGFGESSGFDGDFGSTDSLSEGNVVDENDFGEGKELGSGVKNEGKVDSDILSAISEFGGDGSGSGSGGSFKEFNCDKKTIVDLDAWLCETSVAVESARKDPYVYFCTEGGHGKKASYFSKFCRKSCCEVLNEINVKPIFYDYEFFVV